MSEQLARYTVAPMEEVERAATAMFKSKFFADSTNVEQAIVKIMAGQEIGIGPFASMNGIHIIQGKPTYGANILAAKVKGSGKYDYRVLEISEKNCILEFYQGTVSLGKSSFSLEDARKSGTKNIDKFPRNMLFARAISNGIKWFCPDVLQGVTAYVPEEFGAVVNDEGVIIEGEFVTHELKQPAAPVPDRNHEAAIAEAEEDAKWDGSNLEPEQKQDPNPLRYQPAQLREKIQLLTRQYAKTATQANDKQKQLMAAMMSSALPDNDKRHLVQYYLTGMQSIKEMGDAEILALLKWLEPTKQADNKYYPNGMSVREAQAAWTQAMSEANGQQLPL